MSNINNLCMNCMHEIPDSSEKCPHCGFYNSSEQEAPYLPMRTIVAKRYLIGKLIDKNGDGATYMGWDIERKSVVTVREFMPDAIVKRNEHESQINVIPGNEDIFDDYYQSFLDLWRRLARMRGLSALIVVIDIVEDNGTAYAISEHLEGITLREYLLSSSTGYLSWPDARAMFMPVLSTLSNLHSAGIIHRGISPNTLIVCKDKKIRISGFSIWQARASWGELNSELFPGYAAIEQYGFEGQQGPWTDIYAFSAVLYRILIGSTPLEATTRVTNDKMMIPGKFAEQIPAYVINAMINALQILPEDRTRTVEQFRAELSAAPTVTVTDANFKNKIENARKKDTTKRQSVKESEKSTSKNKSKDKKPAKKKKLNSGLKAALIVFGISILIFVILCFTVLKDNIGKRDNSNTPTTSSIQVSKVEVPNFVGQTYSNIKLKRTYTTNFTLLKVEIYSDSVKKGYVISQSVDAGDNVAVGTEITLEVSKGKQQIKFIDVNNMDYADAEKTLTELGFTVEKVEKYNDGTKTPNHVESANLEAGRKYDKGTKVLVQVWGESPTNSNNTTQSTE